MRCFCLLILFFNLSLQVVAQETEPAAAIAEQQLENITENNADQETEDDQYQQQMVQFLKHPLNLNTAGAGDLERLQLLTPVQVQYLLAYRNLVGKLAGLYELQAVPGWDIATIQKIRPYVNVSLEVTIKNTFTGRLRNGEHSLLVRASQVPEKSRGYLTDTSAAKNFYPGSPQKIFMRYRYEFKDLLQYGIVAEKDAGEQFFKGKQRQGFDFYSAHIFIRRIGIIRSLAIGDFTVNLGQGLVQWQSLAFKKSADVLSIKRESERLRPYNAAGEVNFHRGIGITLAKKNWQFTVFGSLKKIDANLVSDTAHVRDDFVSSLQTSGYHRTKSESADKGIQRQLAIGGNFSYRFKKLQLGVNGIKYVFKLPIQKSNEPYNAYAPGGTGFANYSFDYSYTYKNLHFFGEAAISSKMNKAFINSLMLSAASGVDLSLLYRNIARSYTSLYTNAFTENSSPNNEKGLFAGISIRPGNAWRIDAYADLFRFPWLRYRVDAPSTGSDCLVQLYYKPNKQLELYTRYRVVSKAINANPENLYLSPVLQQPKRNWRTQINFKVNTSVTIRNRTELVWFDRNGAGYEQGFLIYIDLLYKPLLKPFSGNLRLQYFDTDGYNSRLYAFENDVLYSYSIPVFYEKGYRYYININYDINKKLAFWLKWSQTIYANKTLVGSGLDEISGNKRSEVRLQALYKF